MLISIEINLDRTANYNGNLLLCVRHADNP